VTPGGAREGCRGLRSRYRVDWGGRVGYLRLALRHGLSVVPVAAAGADGAYIGLNDADRLGRRLGLARDWTRDSWLGLRPLLPPLTAVPRPQATARRRAHRSAGRRTDLARRPCGPSSPARPRAGSRAGAAGPCARETLHRDVRGRETRCRVKPPARGSDGR